MIYKSMMRFLWWQRGVLTGF